MLAQADFVTEAWLAINLLRSWTACYKYPQQGKWSWVALSVQLTWPDDDTIPATSLVCDL